MRHSVEAAPLSIIVRDLGIEHTHTHTHTETNRQREIQTDRRTHIETEVMFISRFFIKQFPRNGHK